MALTNILEPGRLICEKRTVGSGSVNTDLMAMVSLGVSLTRWATILLPFKLVASNRSKPRLYFCITNLRVTSSSLVTIVE